ncbi:hypothetical protein LJR098_002024 [Rhizobium sp. LjRoot98]|uniref:hypothetical protein n=1 Tax=unclassified Rhizobium TaxID=2613769 RepID=UPI0012E3D69C|nr:hypothetical protein [Rhizobium sp. Root1204]
MRVRKSRKRSLSGNDNELGEYFAALEDEEFDSDARSNPSSQGTPGLSSAEEVRRLTAYVAYLRENVSALERPHSSPPQSHSVGAIASFAAMVGVAAVFGILAHRVSRF